MKQSPPNLKFDGDYFRCFLFMFIFFFSFRCSFLLAAKAAADFLEIKSAKSSSDRNLNLGFLFLMQLSSRSKLRLKPCIVQIAAEFHVNGIKLLMRSVIVNYSIKTCGAEGSTAHWEDLADERNDLQAGAGYV